jgi:hypothetical protein
MGIKFHCPSCDKRLHVKSFLAGKPGFCPQCQAKLIVPTESEPKRAHAVEAGGSAILSAPTAPMSNEGEASPALAPHTAGNGQGKLHAPVSPVVPAGLPAIQPAPAYAASPTPAPVIPTAMATPVTATAPYQANVVFPAGMPTGVGVAGAGQPATPAAYATAPGYVTPTTAPAPVAAMPAAVIDPIAEAPQAVWYVRPPAGGQYGPAAGDVMRKWLAEGRVSAEALVWREGWPDWRKGARVFPSLAPTTAVAPVSPGAPVTSAVPSPAAARRTARPPRKRNSTALAVTAIVVLLLASIGLLIGLLWVLGVLG